MDLLRFGLKILLGNKARCYTLIFAVALSSVLVTLPSAIILGVCKRSCRILDDVQMPSIWVVDPSIQDPDIPPLFSYVYLERAKNHPDVAWAMPYLRVVTKATLPSGEQEPCYLVGVDPIHMPGRPPLVEAGDLKELSSSRSVFIDGREQLGRLRYVAKEGTSAFLRIGDHIEINRQEAWVRGISRASPSFYSFALLYTSYEEALSFLHMGNPLLSAILIEPKPGIEPAQLCHSLQKSLSPLLVLTREQFTWKILRWFSSTGVLVNFAVAVGTGTLLGFFLVFSIFSNFVRDHLHLFAVLRAQGIDKGWLVGIVSVQALFVSLIGYGCGLGISFLILTVMSYFEVLFFLPWPVLLICGGSIFLICLSTALFFGYRILLIPPATVFRGGKALS